MSLAHASAEDFSLVNFGGCPHLPPAIGAPPIAPSSGRRELELTRFGMSAYATSSLSNLLAAPAEALAVTSFWRAVGSELWFAKDADFDQRFRARFIASHEAASLGEHPDWATSAEGALALAILFDQFPRNAFRGSPRMYATDFRARAVAAAAIDTGHDRAVEDDMALFFYLPFAHSERLEDQERSVQLNQRLPEPSPTHSRRHRDIVRRFGRFPHRNLILGRAMTAEEQRYLDEGGYKG